MGAAKTEGANMRVTTIDELKTYTRNELIELGRYLQGSIPLLPIDSTERSNARITLYNLRHVLARRLYADAY
jgi:hypothetical protein